MNFYLYSPVYFEAWDWRNSVEKGIGGSETSHVEMAWRLAKRGHKVITYAPIPDDCSTMWRGTEWHKLEEVDWKQKGIWVLYRTPKTVDKFSPKSKRQDQIIWMLMQDWDYPDWTEKRIKECDRILAMSKAHAKNMFQHFPSVKGLLYLISNGVKLDLIAETESKEIKRNPKKIIYTSSPDRGLKPALLSFKKAREYIPDLEFHAFYGFDNIDKLIKLNPNNGYSKIKAELMKLLDQPGVTFHGRITQNELYEHWLSAGIWIYQTNFFETSCISLMEAQSMGAVPIFSPVYAQGENIKHGIAIAGNANDSLTNARFGAELVKLASHPEIQDKFREEMIPWARQTYDWERMVDLWECWALKKEYPYEYPTVLKESDYVGW